MSNVGSSNAHNRRTQEYLANIPKGNLYIRQDLTPKNEEWESEAMKKHVTLAAYHDMQKALVKEKTGRRMQEKTRQRVNKKTGRVTEVNGSSSLRESVVVCNLDTTMAQLQDYVQMCHEAFGIMPLQIFIHRDEGHYEQTDGVETWKPNTHAHIVWDWIDHNTGKSFKLNKADISKMQDFVSMALGMERGISKAETGAEHLDRNDYILSKQKEELAVAEVKKLNLDAEIEDREEQI